MRYLRMIRPIQWLLAAAIVCVSASAQEYSIDVYTNLTTDGTNVYATGVLQYSPGSNCSMCATAFHQYQETGQLTSPSGRSAYCNNSAGVGAGSSENLQCSTELALNTDYGNYQMTFNPVATCSVIGVFLSTVMQPVINVKVTTTYFGPNLPGNPVFCNYPTGACTPGTTPTCGPPHLTAFAFPSCYSYIRSSWLVVNGSCTASIDFAAGDGGPCN
jgi:hypothetical protein